MNHVHEKNEKSLGELLSDLSNDIQKMIREGISLFKSEMSDEISRTKKSVVSIIVGGAVLYAGLLAFVAAVVLLLALIMPAWVSTLIVAVVGLGTGYFLIQKGIAGLKRIDFTPKETISILKGDMDG